MIQENEIEEITKLPGEFRGSAFATDMAYVLKHAGKEGIEKLEAKLSSWKHPIAYERIKKAIWYPIGLQVLSLLAAEEVFGWTEKDIHDMGYSGPENSFTMKIVLKYFVGLKKTYQQSPFIWSSHYSVGRLVNPDLKDEGEEKHAVFQIFDFKIHPVLCTYLAGYILKLCELTLHDKKRITSFEETRCVFRGDECHEFIAKWK
ncbi:MAG: hypothetical protein NT129_03050 [Candidatus Aenigmarchaeota archaeon]|nr:hypothetical protein [Candidatus Aenigmarchaeota archaeon]